MTNAKNKKGSFPLEVIFIFIGDAILCTLVIHTDFIIIYNFLIPTQTCIRVSLYIVRNKVNATFILTVSVGRY